MKPRPDCPYCGGKGVVTDWVDFGPGRVAMESVCECTAEDYPANEVCGTCGASTDFTMNDEWAWRSDCCGAPAKEDK